MFFHYQRLKSLLLFSVIKVLFTSSKRTSSFHSLFQALSRRKGVKLRANDERQMCLSRKQPNPTASRFDNITKELINAIGENSTPKSIKKTPLSLASKTFFIYRMVSTTKRNYKRIYLEDFSTIFISISANNSLLVIS